MSPKHPNHLHLFTHSPSCFRMRSYIYEQVCLFKNRASIFLWPWKKSMGLNLGVKSHLYLESVQVYHIISYFPLTIINDLIVNMRFFFLKKSKGWIRYTLHTSKANLTRKPGIYDTPYTLPEKISPLCLNLITHLSQIACKSV